MSGRATPTAHRNRGADCGRAAAAPLGPQSLTWRCFGDSRGLLLALRAGVLQAMHPAISAALCEHSDVFENPLWRLARSAGPILGVVYDERPEATAGVVRDRHSAIRGSDARGRRYHALDPGTFYWAHATFFEGQIATQELFGRPLAAAQKEQLYAESVTWYARYGLSMRPVPADYGAFERYWAAMLDDVLEATPIALAAVTCALDLGVPHPALEGAPRQALRWPIDHGGAWLIRATLPPRARDILGVELTEADGLALNALQVLIRAAWPALPARLRRLPRSGEPASSRRHADAANAPY